jgi:hypothetical protein
MWIVVGGVSLVLAIAAATLLTIWAMSAAEREPNYPEDNDGQETR